MRDLRLRPDKPAGGLWERRSVMRKVLMVGLVMGLAGCSSVDLARRHGVVVRHDNPRVIRDGAGQPACVLWANGELEMLAPADLVARIMLREIDGLREAMKGQMGDWEKERTRLQLELQGKVGALERAERAQKKAEQDLASAKKELELQAAKHDRALLEAELARSAK